MHLKFLLLIFFCFFTLTVSAQEKQGANWFFGGYDPSPSGIQFPGIHLDFNQPDVPVSNFFVKNMTTGSAATISDRTGKLLFFTRNGYVATRLKVNNEYQYMPNGTLSGPLLAAELIIQNPIDENRFYIFSTIFYQRLGIKEVDMRLNNGLGDVVPNSYRTLSRKMGIGMAALLHANKKDSWLLSASASGDTLFAYPVTASGLGVPVISLTNKKLDSLAWLKSSPNSEMLVTSGKNVIELFHFDRQTGTVSSLYSLILPDSAKQKGFSYSFSPNSSKLYVGTMRQSYYYPGSILQYDLAAGSPQQVQQSVTTLYSDSSNHLIRDMQLAIDGKIYISRGDYNQYLSEIRYPDQAGFSCGFKLQGKPLSGVAHSLPALNQTLFRNAGILQAQASRDTICYGDSVQLSAYGAGAERFRWQIANGLTSPNDTLANPVVWPSATTTYQVIGSTPFRTDSAFVRVEVLPKTEIKINGATQVFTFSEDQVYAVENPQPDLTYNWQISGGKIISGQGGQKISVNWETAGTGTVEVSATNAFGCESSKAVLNIEVSGSPQPVFYNIITPNNDNKNDAFVIKNLKWYEENELVIYNRWGVEVFRSRNYKNDWQAENLSNGVYFYRFSANGKQSWKGWIEVVK